MSRQVPIAAAKFPLKIFLHKILVNVAQTKRFGWIVKVPCFWDLLLLTHQKLDLIGHFSAADYKFSAYNEPVKGSFHSPKMSQLPYFQTFYSLNFGD